MKPNLVSFAIAICSASFASCAQGERPATVVKAAPAGARFEDVGRLTFHSGQPCTPQIMFDFRGAHSKTPVSLAVNSHEEKTLIEAVHRRRRVRISGKWQHGRARGCAYVSVIAVDVQKSIWPF